MHNVLNVILLKGVLLNVLALHYKLVGLYQKKRIGVLVCHSSLLHNDLKTQVQFLYDCSLVRL